MAHGRRRLRVLAITLPPKKMRLQATYQLNFSSVSQEYIDTRAEAPPTCDKLEGLGNALLVVGHFVEYQTVMMREKLKCVGDCDREDEVDYVKSIEWSLARMCSGGIGTSDMRMTKQLARQPGGAVVEPPHAFAPASTRNFSIATVLTSIEMRPTQFLGLQPSRALFRPVPVSSVVNGEGVVVAHC